MSYKILTENEFEQLSSEYIQNSNMLFLKLVSIGHITTQLCDFNAKKISEITRKQNAFWLLCDKENDLMQFLQDNIERFKRQYGK